MAVQSSLLDRRAQIGDVGHSFRRLLSRVFRALVVIFSGGELFLLITGRPGAMAFALIAISSLFALHMWANRGEGLPIIPLLLVQNVVIYGLPLLVSNEAILQYPETFMNSAGWEVFASTLAMILAWRMTIEFVPAYSPLCFALQGFEAGSTKLARIGLTLLVAGTGYDTLQSTGMLDSFIGMLPSGSNSIIHVLVSAAATCGFFLAGMMVGKGQVGRGQRAIFWVLLAVECFISASGFLLSAAATTIFAAMIGLFWGSGKIPWRLVVVAIAILAFLNVGKFVMRDKYWHRQDDEPQAQFTLAEMPQHYSEWASASFDVLTGKPIEKSSKDSFATIGSTDTHQDEQSLLSRINNLQNLLFVINAEQADHIPPVNGATYRLIPPLLVPRILWPDKPRTHEGQVMLNVHFGRQDLASTLQTYVAWGLLPEAYGNFGPITGAVILGLFLGMVFAWVERFVAKKLLLSTEGFLSFTLFLGMANSYEMVASVLVTSLFQAFIPIIIASAPFVDRVLPKRAPPELVDA
jgi:hypothetical protein